MAFNIGLSGIRAASTDLEVTGNNVANASTTGFKESRAEFADVYTTTLLGTGTKPVGSGVMVDNVRQEFSQGNISGTENALDMAIDGNGFFIVEDRGSIAYTRAGLFSLDKDGFVVTNSGARVQGFDANSDGVVNGVLDDIQIQVGNQSPALTSRVSAILNLDAGEGVLQEQGLQLTANGLAIATPDSGIIESTATTLATQAQPTGPGAPASNTMTATVASFVGALGATSISIDLNDGNGAQAIPIAALTAPAPATNQAVIDHIQDAIDDVLGQQQIRVQEAVGGEVELVRDGYAATTGLGFSVPVTGTLGAVTATVNGSVGNTLFVGASKIAMNAFEKSFT